MVKKVLMEQMVLMLLLTTIRVVIVVVGRKEKFLEYLTKNIIGSTHIMALMVRKAIMEVIKEEVDKEELVV